MYLTGNILMVYNEPILTTDLVFLNGYPLRHILDAPSTKSALSILNVEID